MGCTTAGTGNQIWLAVGEEKPRKVVSTLLLTVMSAHTALFWVVSPTSSCSGWFDWWDLALPLVHFLYLVINKIFLNLWFFDILKEYMWLAMCWTCIRCMCWEILGVPSSMISMKIGIEIHCTIHVLEDRATWVLYRILISKIGLWNSLAPNWWVLHLGCLTQMGPITFSLGLLEY